MSTINNPINSIGMGKILGVGQESADSKIFDEIEHSVIQGAAVSAAINHPELYSARMSALERDLASHNPYAEERKAPVGNIPFEPKPRDKYTNFLTQEQEAQSKIDAVFGEPESGGGDSYRSINEIVGDDDRDAMLGEIEALRASLIEDYDYKKQPTVNENSDINDIRRELKKLEMKSDRQRCVTFAEEGILMLANTLADIFDGETEIFGRKPMLVGWPDTVQSKLRRMRPSTSSFVQDIMRDYHISGGWRILAELVPSMILYSRRQRTTTDSGDRLNREPAFKDACSKLNDV